MKIIAIIILFIILNILEINGVIPKSIHDFITSNKRLDKYSITLLSQYEHNSTEKWAEESIILKRNPPNLLNPSLEGEELTIAVCKGQGFDCFFEEKCRQNYAYEILNILGKTLNFT